MNWNEQKKHYMKILETIENDSSIREIVAPALCCAPEKQGSSADQSVRQVLRISGDEEQGCTY